MDDEVLGNWGQHDARFFERLPPHISARPLVRKLACDGFELIIFADFDGRRKAC